MPTEHPTGRFSALPWIVMIAGDGFAAWRGYLAAWWYRQWQNDRLFDPSGAELSYVNAQVEAALAVVGLCVAGVGIGFLLRAQRNRRRQLAGEPKP